MVQVALADYLAALSAGRLVSFPTDTVPALAAAPEASDRIYQLKQRSTSKPLILMAASFADLRPYLAGDEAAVTAWTRLIERYWPGALTLVLPASDRLPPAMNLTGTASLGVRVPAHPLAQYILARSGPLATTSVNRSGQPPLQTMAAIEAEFPQLVTLSPQAIAALYPGFSSPPPAPDQPQGSGQPSTVVAWQDQGWQVLRQGALNFEQ
jgi:L-threonylcarbamoyladenylate synthase